MINLANGILLGGVTLVLALSLAYFRRYDLPRPPIGVMNLRDVTWMMASIIVIPYLYLWLPIWLVAGLTILGGWSLLLLLIEPLTRRAWLRWLISGLLVGLDVLALVRWGPQSQPFVILNGILICLLVVAVVNLWVQSGLKARDATLLGAFLILYDITATTLLPVMGEMMERVAAIPLAPQLMVPVAGGRWLGIGMGDMVLAALFPLVLWKAYSLRAGLIALGAAWLSMAALFGGLTLLAVEAVFPVMVVLGPLMLVQYAFWRWRCGPERTMAAFMAARRAVSQRG